MAMEKDSVYRWEGLRSSSTYTAMGSHVPHWLQTVQCGLSLLTYASTRSPIFLALYWSPWMNNSLSTGTLGGGANVAYVSPGEGILTTQLFLYIIWIQVTSKINDLQTFFFHCLNCLFTLLISVVVLMRIAPKDSYLNAWPPVGRTV